MNDQEQKKHNKLVSWFLKLPKWGKILLIGGSVAGVATAITVPTVIALTRSDSSNKLDYAAADAWATKHLSYRSYIRTGSEDPYTYSRFDDYNNISNSFKSGDMNWNSSTQAGTELLIAEFGKLFERSNNPGYKTNCPLQGSTTLIAEKIKADNKISTDEIGDLVNELGVLAYIPKKEAKGEEGLARYELFINENYEFTAYKYKCEYYKLKNDGFRIHVIYDSSKQLNDEEFSGTGYTDVDYNNKGIIYKVTKEFSGTFEKIGEMKLNFEMNLDFGI